MSALDTLCAPDSTGDGITDAICALSEVSPFDLQSSGQNLFYCHTKADDFFSHWHLAFPHFVSRLFQPLQQVGGYASAETLDGVIAGLDTFFLLFAVSLRHFVLDGRVICL
jgi:hypothetical protein